MSETTKCECGHPGCLAVLTDAPIEVLSQCYLRALDRERSKSLLLEGKLASERARAAALDAEAARVTDERNAYRSGCGCFIATPAPTPIHGSAGGGTCKVCGRITSPDTGECPENESGPTCIQIGYERELTARVQAEQELDSARKLLEADTERVAAQIDAGLSERVAKQTIEIHELKEKLGRVGALGDMAVLRSEAAFEEAARLVEAVHAVPLRRRLDIAAAIRALADSAEGRERSESPAPALTEGHAGGEQEVWEALDDVVGTFEGHWPFPSAAVTRARLLLAQRQRGGK